MISLLSVGHCRCRRPPPHGLPSLPTIGLTVVFPISPTQAIATAAASSHYCLLFFIVAPSPIFLTPSPCCLTSLVVTDAPRLLLHLLAVAALFLYFSLLQSTCSQPLATPASSGRQPSLATISISIAIKPSSTVVAASSASSSLCCSHLCCSQALLCRWPALFIPSYTTIATYCHSRFQPCPLLPRSPRWTPFLPCSCYHLLLPATIVGHHLLPPMLPIAATIINSSHHSLAAHLPRFLLSTNSYKSP
ncbi:hypothetical protein BHE74_00027570 [Ensete ventricosum]|nr:hypothetical protein BHE74_00027570 [Ensete ventricosum]RZR90856.1 hypothetical protein BHM03_00018835 [Ensete ventricosum]